MNWTPLTYKLGFAQEFVADGVTRYFNGKVKLSIASGKSAGVLNGPMKAGDYTFTIYGRLDTLDPMAVFAVWAYNEETTEEVDFIEATRWRDCNNPNLFHLTHHRDGQPTILAAQPARAFNKYVLTVQVRQSSVNWQLYGAYPSYRLEGQKDAMLLVSGAVQRSVIGFNLKVALWLYNTKTVGGPFLFGNSQKGLTSVSFEGKEWNS